MLYELIRSLGPDCAAAGLIASPCVRALLAALTALVIGFAFGPWMIRELKALHFGQAVRTCGPKTHLAKDGTPTMGGALILAGIALGGLLWADLSNRFVWLVLIVTLGYGAIGWIDDYRKVVHHDPRGMSAREKFAWQSVIGLVVAFTLAVALSAGPARGSPRPPRAGTTSAFRSTSRRTSISSSRGSATSPSRSGSSASSSSRTS